MDLLRTDDGCVFNSDGVASSDDGEPPFRWPSLPRHMDIVKGNRYRMDAKVSVEYGLVPDDSGPWLALVTFRGEKATPRPEVLPVGTRVRRGPDWDPGFAEGVGVGEVVGHESVFTNVRWPGCTAVRAYVPISLEVVSLPEPAKAEPFVVLKAGDCGWMSDGSIFGFGDREEPDPRVQALFMAGRFRAGTWYMLDGEVTQNGSGDGFKCMVDFVGPNYVAPKAEPEVTSGQYARVAGKPAAEATLVAGPGVIGSSTGHEIRVGGASVATAKPSSAAFKVEWLDRAMAGIDQVTIGGVTYTMATATGPKATVTDDVRVKVGVPDKATHGDMVNLGRRLPGQIQSVCMLPDYLPPRIAKARGRTFVVPTDLDIDNFPDADEGMRGRIR